MNLSVILQSYFPPGAAERCPWWESFQQLKQQKPTTFWSYVDEALRAISESDNAEKFTRCKNRVKERSILIVAGLRWFKDTDGETHISEVFYCD